jgi:hypothetical protein
VNSRGLADFFDCQLCAAENDFVGKAQNPEALLTEPFVSTPVMQPLLFGIVRRSIEFDDQPRLERDEVSDIAANRYLPLEL